MNFVGSAKKLLAGACLSFALVAGQGAMSAAHAEKTPTIILIVDPSMLFNGSLAGQDAARQVREQTEALRDEDLKIREAIQNEVTALHEEKDKLPGEEWQAKALGLQQQLQAHVQTIGLRQQALQLGEAQARAEMAAVIKPIFSELLVKHGAGLLVNQSAVIAGGVDLNITAEAMALLNQRLPKITVTPVDPASLTGAE